MKNSPASARRARVRDVASRALATGQLCPIPTSTCWHRDQGVSFLVRIVDSLARKPRPVVDSAAVPTPTARRNPFLPYERELYVEHVSPTHVALLNKFPVVADHLLLVTREFVPQCTRLTGDDFAAWAEWLVAYPSLGFYNSGTAAGASQPHRHLQLIPLPLAEGGPALPVAELLPGDAPFDQPWVGTRVPFAHHGFRWSPIDVSQASHLGAQLLRAYDRLLETQGWTELDESTPYNLLVTRDWMLLVPRRAEFYRGVSLNALAFAGALLVQDESQRDHLLSAGLMAGLIAASGR